MNLNGKAIKNASWIIVCRVVQSLISLIIGICTARYLNPDNYGLLDYAKSVIAFVAPFAQLGLPNVLVDEIISRPEQEGKTLGTSLVSSVIASLFCIGGCLAFVSVANAGETDTLIVCALYSISLIFQVTEMVQYWYQAKLMSKYVSVTSLAAYIVIAAYKVYLLATGKSVYWFAVSTAFDYMIISVVLVLIYNKLGGGRLSFSWDVFKRLFSRSKYYIISSLMVTLFSQTDKIMIKIMIGNAENGYYAAATTCAAMTSFVFSAIIDSFRPIILSNKKDDQVSYEKNVTRLYSIMIYIALLQSVVLTVFAKYVVGILYGKAYVAAIPILQIITWYSAFSYMGPVRNIWILAEGKQKYLWQINLIGALLNIAGNFILIPLLGACGAAIASVATQFFTNFILCLIMKPVKPMGPLIWRALNPRVLIDMVKSIKK